MKNIFSKDVGIVTYVVLTIATAYGTYVREFCWQGETCQKIDFGGISALLGYASVLLSLVWLYITIKFLIKKLWNKN